MNVITQSYSDDVILLKQLASGDKQAFNILYEKYWEIAYSDACKRLKDTEQAKDIVQEIFTHIWLKRDTLRIDNFGGYIYIAVRNQVFKLIATQKRKHPFFDILSFMPLNYMQAQADGNLLWKEFIISYEAILNTLPPKRQMIFRLRFQEDLSTTQIATQLGLSRKTIQNQLLKAVEQLRISLLQLLTVLIFIVFHS